MCNLKTIRKMTRLKGFIYNQCQMGTIASTHCLIMKVGTGSSSHDFDGDFMITALIYK